MTDSHNLLQEQVELYLQFTVIGGQLNTYPHPSLDTISSVSLIK